MFNQLTEWEIPETTVTTLPTAHDITAVAKNDKLLGYTKSEVDHAGVLETDNNIVHEYSLECAAR
ncbi:MAG: hypothetical protein ACO3MW_15285 [Rhodospirillales bacterium]|jgi:hypothetical protein